MLIINNNNEVHYFCTSHNRKWPGKQNINRVETNYSPGIGEGKIFTG